MLKPSLLTAVCLAGIFALVSDATAQHLNTTLLSHWKRISTSVKHNDVWGITTPGGKEFAIYGEHLGMAIFDASLTPANPKFVAVWSTAYVHDACIRRGKAYVCNGYSYQTRILDIRNPSSISQLGSCPTKATKLASYDTSTHTPGYFGAWGCYPFQDSGAIYVSDMQSGFYAMQVDCGHMNRFGTGTKGSSEVPRARFDGAAPRVGASQMRFELENLEPNQPFWVVASASAATSTGTLSSSRGMWAGICK